MDREFEIIAMRKRREAYKKIKKKEYKKKKKKDRLQGEEEYKKKKEEEDRLQREEEYKKKKEEEDRLQREEEYKKKKEEEDPLQGEEEYKKKEEEDPPQREEEYKKEEEEDPLQREEEYKKKEEEDPLQREEYEKKKKKWKEWVELHEKDNEECMKEHEKEKEEERAYWDEVWKSNGFDVDHLKRPRSDPGVVPIDFKKYDIDITDFILYARIGIHKYNMFEGTNLKYERVEKVNYLPESYMRHIFHITFLAKHPAHTPLRRFQTSIVWLVCGVTSLTCYIARPKPKPAERRPGRLHHGPGGHCYQCELPDQWPSLNDLNDKKRFYVVQESELLKYDWIRLYMEVAFLEATKSLESPKPELSKLVISNVAVETMENVESPNERLMARDATFYIRYTYPGMGHRLAVVRRIMKEESLSLLFKKSSLH